MASIYSTLPPHLQGAYNADSRVKLYNALLGDAVSGAPTNGWGALSTIGKALIGRQGMDEAKAEFEQKGQTYNDALAKALAGAQSGDFSGFSNPELGPMGSQNAIAAALMDRKTQAELAADNRAHERALELAGLQHQYNLDEKTDPGVIQAEIDIARARGEADLTNDMKLKMAEHQLQYGGTPAPAVPVNTSPEIAAKPVVGSLGAPLPDTNPFEGLSPKEAASMAADLRQQIIKDFQEGRESVQNARSMIEQLDRFVELIDGGLYTGGAYNIPGAQGVMGALSPDVSEAQAITSRMTPMMRQGMPGAASDRDVAMFQGATVGIDKPEQANRNIAAGLKVSQQNLIERDEFLQAYFDQNKHLQGAERAWQRYLNANPIFVPDSKDYTLNDKRVGWREFFAGSSGAPAAPSSPATGASDVDPLGILGEPKRPAGTSF
ncbi:MAG: hypothetical protein VX464_11645 [Pseudomonadota bacterium]|nr:hypothetical protein [Pseudomonadota bacterium]